MIQFLYPELFLLAIPIGFVFYRWCMTRGVSGVIRVLILVLLVLSLTGPEMNLGGDGLDVVIIADRSLSMPGESHENVRELIQNLGGNRGAGDRIGLITFGTEPELEHMLSANVVATQYTKPIQQDGSDLNEAIMRGLMLVDPKRPARILVFSDGEYNGASPLSAARRARELGVPIDYRMFERIRVGDVAVESIDLPKTVAPREPFQSSVWIHADRSTQGTVTIFREEEQRPGQEQVTTQVSQQTMNFYSGRNRIDFRDVHETGGFYQYIVKLEVEGDPLPENNSGLGVLRVDAGPKVLVLNADGLQDTNLVRALEAAKLPVDVRKAKDHPLTLDSLDPYRAVIVENVPADHLGRQKMARLAQFVEDLGGGLMLTGGERSFGTGGYFKSPLDDILPVSMELREEHRRNKLAMAIVMDRSGSMAMPVRGGLTKMDLANLGASECIRMLSEYDMISVITVDTSAHIVQKMANIEAPDAMISKVKRIRSQGGGIFIYPALLAAQKQLESAEGYETRHVILFSDANDSERPGNYPKLLEEFEQKGITVSVIGLGNTSNVHAPLLTDIAKRGNGNIMFTEDPQELPRLFAQDTMSVARSSFIKADAESSPLGISAVMRPEIRLVGQFDAGGFPNVGGYNLSYIKPKATIGVQTKDEYNAPLSAYWYRGLGRVAALTVEVDGKFSGQFGQWADYEDFLITHTRWLLEGDNPNDVFVEVKREGQDALVTVELDPRRTENSNRPPTLQVIPSGDERQQVITPDFEWVDANVLQARFLLNQVGTYRTQVQTGEREAVRGPALALPYSPEYMPRTGFETGSETLKQIAEISGGRERTDVVPILEDPPRSASVRPLLPHLMIATIVLLVIEIAGRRLQIWSRIREWFLNRKEPKVESETAAVPKTKASWIPQWKVKFRRDKPTKSDPESKSKKKSPPRPAPQPVARPTGDDIFRQAKDRAKRRRNE